MTSCCYSPVIEGLSSERVHCWQEREEVEIGGLTSLLPVSRLNCYVGDGVHFSLPSVIQLPYYKLHTLTCYILLTYDSYRIPNHQTEDRLSPRGERGREKEREREPCLWPSQAELTVQFSRLINNHNSLKKWAASEGARPQRWSDIHKG